MISKNDHACHALCLDLLSSASEAVLDVTLRQAMMLPVGNGYTVSTQAPRCRRQMAERLNLPYSVRSVEGCALADASRLPTFRAEDDPRLIRRLTMVRREGPIEEAFTPVLPPDSCAEPVPGWLRRT